LRKAIEAGRPLDAYRALWWASRLGRFKGELAETAKLLLVHRRVFYKRLTGAPSMFTYNGVGTSLYGNADFDRNDATYVATLYIVVVFVPVFPIASYLVRDASNNGRRAWSFMAKVPLGAANFLWQRAFALAILAMVASGAVGAVEGYGHNTLHVVNGLSRPVSVALSGYGEKQVAAGAELAMRTTVGPHTITVRDGDRELESSPVDVPRGRGAVVWNVIGAAPLYVEKVIYSPHGDASPPEAKERPDVMCGESFVVRDGLDYPLEDPPKQLETSKDSGYTIKTHMAVAPGGLHTCLAWLASHGDGPKAAHLALKVSGLLRTPAKQLDDDVESFVMMAPPAEAEGFVKDLLARDDSVEAHRLYQNWLLATHQRPRAVAEYGARAQARPADADAQYLALRVRTLDEERPVVDGIVARFPDHKFLRRAQIYVHYADFDLPGTLAACEALRKLDVALWLRSVDEHVEALVAGGRGNDALELANGVARDTAQPPGVRSDAEVIAYRVAHRIGAPEPPIRDDDEEHSGQRLLFVHARSGVDLLASEIDLVKSDTFKEALRIAKTARKSPDGAISLVRSATPDGVQFVPLPIRVLLLGEAARKAETRDLVEKLGAGQFPKQTLDGIVAYLTTGAAPDEVTELPLEVRAALDFARSRAPGVTAKEKKDRLDRAKASDVLHGPVTVAIEGWPS
jgi:hypothetical protein